MYKKLRCVTYALLLILLFCISASPAYAGEVAQEKQEAQDERAAESGEYAAETWNPSDDPASDSDGGYLEAAKGTLSMTVKYTSGISAEPGDTFDIVYQVIGSDAPATITFKADEIDGYVGEIEIPEGTYEVLDLKYTGEREDIRSYGIENTFTVSQTEDGAVCLVIGKNGVFNLAGQEGYFTLIDEEDMEGEEPQESDTGSSVDEAEEKEESLEFKGPGAMRAVPVLILAVVMAAGIHIAKKRGILE